MHSFNGMDGTSMHIYIRVLLYLCRYKSMYVYIYILYTHIMCMYVHFERSLTRAHIGSHLGALSPKCQVQRAPWYLPQNTKPASTSMAATVLETLRKPTLYGRGVF